MKIRKLVATCVFVALPALAQSNNQEDQNQKDKVVSLMDSMAGGVYKLAWPTATYRSWRFDDFRRVQGGYRLVVKLSGLSVWDDSDLWLKLGFLVNSDGLKNVRVIDHNAILVPPFKTSETIGRLASDLATQYAQSNPVRSAPPPLIQMSPAAPATPVAYSPTKAGAVCVENFTNSTLKFSYRWGTDTRLDGTIESGRADVMWWPYTSDTDQSSPQFEIEYDDSFAEGYTGQRYVLERYAVSLPATCDSAKTYKFTADGLRISLTSVN